MAPARADKVRSLTEGGELVQTGRDDTKTETTATSASFISRAVRQRRRAVRGLTVSHRAQWSAPSLSASPLAAHDCASLHSAPSFPERLSLTRRDISDTSECRWHVGTCCRRVLMSRLDLPTTCLSSSLAPWLSQPVRVCTAVSVRCRDFQLAGGTPSAAASAQHCRMHV